MSLTVNELASSIQNIECKYASFTNKLSLALQYGSSNLECLQNTAFIVKSNLDILKKFYSEGKVCTTCDISGTWMLTHECGYINSPYTTYICYYDSLNQSYVNSYWQFDSGGTVNVTKDNGDEITGTYVISDDNIIFTGLTGSLVNGTIVNSINCNSMEIFYDNPLNAQTITGYFIRLTGDGSTCDWAEYCITEAEAEDLIKDCYKRLSSTCNC